MADAAALAASSGRVTDFLLVYVYTFAGYYSCYCLVYCLFCWSVLAGWQNGLVDRSWPRPCKKNQKHPKRLPARGHILAIQRPPDWRLTRGPTQYVHSLGLTRHNRIMAINNKWANRPTSGINLLNTGGRQAGCAQAAQWRGGPSASVAQAPLQEDRSWVRRRTRSAK